MEFFGVRFVTFQSPKITSPRLDKRFDNLLTGVGWELIVDWMMSDNIHQLVCRCKVLIEQLLLENIVCVIVKILTFVAVQHEVVT